MSLLNFVKKFFYLFLDISGSLLGIFFVILGLWLKNGKPMPVFMGWIVIGLGVCALIVHMSHYLVARKYGSEYFRTTRNKK